MKIESSDSAFASLEKLKALQDKIQELKRKGGVEEMGDRTSLHARQPSGMGSGTFSEETSKELSFEQMQHSLEKIKRTGQHAHLGEMHANLNMDRVQELLRPLR